MYDCFYFSNRIKVYVVSFIVNFIHQTSIWFLSSLFAINSKHVQLMHINSILSQITSMQSIVCFYIGNLKILPENLLNTLFVLLCFILQNRPNRPIQTLLKLCLLAAIFGGNQYISYSSLCSWLPQDWATHILKEQINFIWFHHRMPKILDCIKKKKVGFSLLTFGLTPQRETIFAKCRLDYKGNAINQSLIWSMTQ